MDFEDVEAADAAEAALESEDLTASGATGVSVVVKRLDEVPGGGGGKAAGEVVDAGGGGGGGSEVVA